MGRNCDVRAREPNAAAASGGASACDRVDAGEPSFARTPQDLRTRCTEVPMLEPRCLRACGAPVQEGFCKALEGPVERVAHRQRPEALGAPGAGSEALPEGTDESRAHNADGSAPAVQHAHGVHVRSSGNTARHPADGACELCSHNPASSTRDRNRSVGTRKTVFCMCLVRRPASDGSQAE
jgi:hypothetical protein